MSLDALDDDVDATHDDLGESLAVPLDRETRHELALLTAVLAADPSDLVRRAVHLLFQSTVDAGKLDFHLRSEYDLTYDEYLAGMTYDEMTGADQYPQRADERRYQM